MEKNVFMPARVRFQAVTEQTDVDKILEAINRQTLEPLKADEVFWFSGNCSNDGLDSHHTRMDAATTLKNYERSLISGVPLLEGHNTTLDPYGRSFGGELLPSSKTGATAEVRGDWFIPRSLEINGKNTDQTIRAIKAGVIRDLSVGFGGGWYRCSSCGNDLMDYNKCSHFPGVADERGETVFAWIIDADLREVSTVYKGSAPGAYIDKARAFAQQGELTGARSAALEKNYGIELSKTKGFFIPTGGKTKMNLIEQIRAAIKDGQIETKAILDAVTPDYRQPDDVQLRNELGEAATVDGVKQLKAEAENGRKYLSDLVTRAVEARVKVQGDGFNKDSYKNVLERSGDIDYIKSEAAAFEKQAKEKFGGGRQTEPEQLGGKQEPTETRSDDDFKDDNIFARK